MQPSRCQSLLNLQMKVAVKCPVTLFYSLSHLLRECKPKPEPVLQQFSYEHHTQQPATHAQGLVSWALT